MKKVKFLMVGCLFILSSYSCGGSKESTEQEEKELSFDDKAKEVCECFEEAGNDSSERPKCFQLQDKYSKSVGDKKTEFLQETNKCM